MELESQIVMNSNINMFHETVFYDILSQNNYLIGHYNNTENEDINMLKQDVDNVMKSDINGSNLEPLNQNISHMVKFPVNLLTPPPPKVGFDNNNVVRKFHTKDSNGTTRRGSYRPISPKEYDSDESCATYSPKDAHQNIGKI